MVYFASGVVETAKLGCVGIRNDGTRGHYTLALREIQNNLNTISFAAQFQFFRRVLGLRTSDIYVVHGSQNTHGTGTNFALFSLFMHLSFFN